MTIEQTFKSYKKQNLKVGYKLTLHGKNPPTDRQVILKILKLDGNNQYSYAMTKPLPTGCIKGLKKKPAWKEFNVLLENLDLDDKIGHLFVVRRITKYIVSYFKNEK